jgi:hypothetical protein
MNYDKLINTEQINNNRKEYARKAHSRSGEKCTLTNIKKRKDKMLTTT